jgi:hypothetical protein
LDDLPRATFPGDFTVDLEAYKVWYVKLPKTPASILKYVVTQHPRSVPFSEIALHHGMKTESFKRNYLRMLKTVPGWRDDGNMATVKAGTP